METNKEKIEKMIRSGDYHHMIEVRAQEPDEEGKPVERVIEGTPIVFDQKTELYRYHDDWVDKDIIVHEIIKKGACDNADTRNCFLKFNHDESVMPLARVKNGTLQLDIQEDGVHMKATLADTTAGRDLYTLVKDGTIDKMSFAFTIDEDEFDSVETESEIVVTRTVKKIKSLYDVAAVMVPAYEQTSLYARSKGDVEAFLKAKVETERAKKLEDAKAGLHDFIKQNSCK